ncbi:MAG: hypothetical protein JKY26_17605 [Pseudomonas sp.]|nr:hypothetical protein [Pseudomonas sp.]
MSAPDKNVERNRQLLLDRSLVGLQKYGVTTERGDLTHKQWLQHLLEELLDAANYVQASMHNEALPAIPFGQGCNVSVLSHTLDGGEPSLTLRHLDKPVVGLTFKTEEHKLAVLQALLCGNSFADQSAACDAANEYCQDNRIGEGRVSAVHALIDHHKRLREQLTHSHKQEQRLDDEITELRALKFKSFAGEECWIWQGDESDNLATLVAPVVIWPADLQEIIRQRDEVMQLATPGILKGIARHSGDGFKDPTRQGDVVYVWDTELPAPAAAGQYPRVGNHIYSARNDQFDFTPVPPAQVRQLVDSLIAHERSEKQDANAKVAWLTKQLAALEPVAAPTPFNQEIPQTSASHITTDEHGMGSAMAHTMIKRSENTQ